MKTNIDRTGLSRSTWALLVLGTALASGAAFAAGNAASADALARYQQERAVCLSGQSNQDRATCLREAGAALDQAKRGSLDDGAAQYARNATKRCDGLPDADRQDCIARMQGQGSTSGSVAAGGIVRELTTREVGASSPAKPASAAAAVPAK